MALQKSGLQLTAQGATEFLRDMQGAERAVASFVAETVRAGTKVGAFGQSVIGAFREVGAIGVRALTDVGKAAAGIALDFGGKSLSSAMDLQDAMNVLGATSGATSGELDSLKRLAKELGADLTLPATTAAEAGQAMLELSKAGLSVDQVMGAAKGTMQLAAAANISEAESAEIAANALNAFRLSGDKATLVADMLASAAAKSSIDVKNAADSFKMASSVFSAFQAPVVGAEEAMYDLTTAIALLGNAGIKGSDAGTALKQMLLQLTGPSQIAKEKMQALALAAMSTNVNMEDLTKVGFGNAKERSEGLQGILGSTGLSLEKTGDIAFDASGKMRSLEEIINLVTLGTKNMTDEQRSNYLTSIFGADATRAVIALMQAGPVAFDEMSEAIKRQGSAASLAAAQNAGLRGAIDGFMSTIETAGMTLAEPFLEPLAEAFRSLAADIGKLPIDKWANRVAAGIMRLTRRIKSGSFSDLIPYLESVGLNLGRALTDWIVNALPRALSDFLLFRNKVVDTILAGTPGLITALGQWGKELAGWVMRSAPGMLQSFTAATVDLINIIGNRLPAIIAAFSQWGGAFVNWIITSAPKLILEIGIAAGKIATAVAANIPPIATAFAKWGNEFVAWIPAAWPRMLTEIAKIATSLYAWIAARVPEVTAKIGLWGSEFVAWVRTYTPKMLTELGIAIDKIVLEIGNKRPLILTALGQWGNEFVAWLTKALPAMLAAALSLYSSLQKWIADRVPGIAAELGKWATAFVAWVGPTSAKLLIAAGEMLAEFTKWIINNGPWISQKLITWTAAFTSWVISDATPALLQALAGFGAEILKWIVNKAADIAKEGSVGRSLVSGIQSGISGSWNTFIAWLNGQWAWLVISVKSFFGIASPSTKMANEIGKPLIEGIMSGISSMATSMLSAITSFLNTYLVAPLTAVVTTGYNKARDIVTQIKAGLTSYASDLYNFALTFFTDNVKTPLSNIFSTAANSAYSQARWLIENLRAGFESYTSVIGGFMSYYFSTYIFKPISDGVSSAYNNARAVIDNLRAGFESYTTAIGNFTTTFFNTYVIGPIAGSLAASDAYNKARAIIEQIRAGFESYASTIGTFTTNYFNANIVGPITTMVTSAFGKGKNIVEGIWDGMKANATTLFNFATTYLQDNILTPITNFLPNVLPKGRNIVESIWDGMKAHATTLYNFIGSYLNDNLLTPTANFLPSVFLKGRNVVENLWDGMKAHATTLSGFVGTYLTDNLLTPAGATLSNAWEIGKTFTTSVWNGINNYWRQEVLDKITSGFLVSLPQKFKDILFNLVYVGGDYINSAMDIGLNFVKGIWKGITDFWRRELIDRLGDLVSQLPQYVKDILGITSPSKVAMEQIGIPFAQGIGVGFMEGMTNVNKMISGTVASMAMPQSITPIVSMAQMQGAAASTTTNSYQRNYYYSPNYGSAPQSPQYDFAVMRALEI